MNREIKFRAWDKTSQAYIQDYAHIGMYGELYTAQFHSSAYGKTDPDLALEQYIGKKDKYGKDIYDADVLLIKDRTDKYVVTWWDEYCAFAFVGYHSSEFITANRYNDIEIIGNIHGKNSSLEVTHG